MKLTTDYSRSFISDLKGFLGKFCMQGMAKNGISQIEVKKGLGYHMKRKMVHPASTKIDNLLSPILIGETV